jgi:D-alanyl-lipoteichoic acid acyltransferase DltB (MBOAT superfamily)
MNLMVVFLLSGLWHGANWTYIIWGALNGAYLVIEILIKKINLPFLSSQIPQKLVRVLKILLVFVLSSFAWIFFRANTVSDAFVVIKKIASFKGPLFYENPSMLIYSFAGIFILLLVEMKQEFYTGSFSFMHHKSWVVRNFTYAVLIIILLVMGVFDGGQFIYFQF